MSQAFWNPLRNTKRLGENTKHSCHNLPIKNLYSSGSLKSLSSWETVTKEKKLLAEKNNLQIFPSCTTISESAGHEKTSLIKPKPPGKRLLILTAPTKNRKII